MREKFFIEKWINEDVLGNKLNHIQFSHGLNKDKVTLFIL